MQTQSKHQPVLQLAQPTQRQCTSTTGQAEGCSGQPAADGFLKQRFLPLCQSGGRKLPPKAQTERGFLLAYDNLCNLYGLEYFHSNEGYPASVLLRLWDAAVQLDRRGPYTELSVADESGTIVLRENCNIGYTLHYIPVLPLHRLLRKNTGAGRLLLSVFSYLYQQVGVSYYRDEDSYLYSEYEAIGYWLTDELEEAEDRDKQIALMQQAKKTGDRMFTFIRSSVHLQQFSRRLSSFAPQTDWDRKCLKLAASFYELYTLFPDASIYSHIDMEHEETDTYGYDDYVLYPGHYLAFVAETSGWIWESLFSNINNYLSEFTEIKEPQCITRIDGTTIRITDSLVFEQRLLRLINELVNLLEQQS